MTALNRALALAERDHRAVPVAEHLDLDVAAMLDVALDEQRAVTERRGRLVAGARHGVVELVPAAHGAHAAAAASGRGLHQHRVADGRDSSGNLDRTVRRQRDVVEHRHTGGAHQCLGRDLRTHRRDGRRRRADPHQPGVDHRLGERGRLGEEAVAGVQRARPGPPPGVDEQITAEVGVGGGVAGQAHGDVAHAGVHGAGVSVAEHGDGPDAEAPAGAGDAHGDLTAVGDEQGRDRHTHIRNTP